MIDSLSDDSSKDDVKILNASLSKVVHVHVRVRAYSVTWT